MRKERIVCTIGLEMPQIKKWGKRINVKLDENKTEQLEFIMKQLNFNLTEAVENCITYRYLGMLDSLKMKEEAPGRALGERTNF